MIVEAIFIAGREGEPMLRVAEIETASGLGLAGDRYREGRGHYSPRDVCQVTLIEAEALAAMQEKFGVQVNEGQHRRNQVTRGLALAELRGRRFAIGGAMLEYARPRPPCGYLERITEPRMTRALGEGPGVCAIVVESGLIRAADRIELLPGTAARPVRWLP